MFLDCVFGLWGETGALGETHTDALRTCKLSRTRIQTRNLPSLITHTLCGPLFSYRLNPMKYTTEQQPPGLTLLFSAQKHDLYLDLFQFTATKCKNPIRHLHTYPISIFIHILNHFTIAHSQYSSPFLFFPISVLYSGVFACHIVFFILYQIIIFLSNLFKPFSIYCTSVLNEPA